MNKKIPKILQKDGTIFELRPINSKKSYLNVRGINLDIDKDEIIDILQEVRER
ncbi:MAG: hypothetical protein IIA49_10935 [Bacteroidetes bacterium]|nr:hypothetical protein [Bacteroidota bacterium]MCH7771509.1 hypothetical protein [Bacteroidota bacterium]